MKRLVNALRCALQEEGLLGLTLLCAVSGGADSVALLHAAHALQGELGFPLYAVHVQHGLRGADSLADEALVRELCRLLDVPLTVRDAGLNGSMEDAGMETRAREARRTIFAEEMNALGAQVLLTAHHRDDQTETVLMHLLRGSGLKGLSGMPRCTPFADGVQLRPFLTLPKETLLQAMQGLDFREDGSNRQTITPRNALRLEILPRLDALFPDASAHIAQLAERAGEDERFLEAEALRLYAAALYAAPPVFALHLQTLADAPAPLARRALRRWYEDGVRLAGLAPDERGLCSADTEALMKLLRAGGCVNLPCALAAHAGSTHLHLLRQGGAPLRPAPQLSPVEIDPNRTEYHLPQLTLRQERAEAHPSPPRSADEILLSPALLAQKPVLRFPQSGDRIRPFGASGSKPLRRFLTDRKVDPPFRAALPVLAIGAEVLWIPSLCAAEALRVSAAAEGALRLSVASPHRPFLPNASKE